MPTTNQSKPKCRLCNTRTAQSQLKGLCVKCHYDTKPQRDAIKNREVELPKELETLIAQPKTEDEWKRLAFSLRPVIDGIASGAVKATAAQTAIIKHIMDRAYGKVSKAQEDEQGPSGVVVLPTVGQAVTLQLCPLCLAAHQQHANNQEN